MKTALKYELRISNDLAEELESLLGDTILREPEIKVTRTMARTSLKCSTASQVATAVRALVEIENGKIMADATAYAQASAFLVKSASKLMAVLQREALTLTIVVRNGRPEWSMEDGTTFTAGLSLFSLQQHIEEISSNWGNADEAADNSGSLP